MPDNIQQQMNAAYAAMNGQPAPAATVQPTTVQPVQAAPVQPAVQPAPVYQQPVQYVQAAAPQFAMPPAQPQAAAWGQPQALPMPQAWSVPVTLTIDGEEVTIYIHFDPSTLGNADAVIRALLAQGYAVKHYPKKQQTIWNKGTGSTWRR